MATRYCKRCNKELKPTQKKYCSNSCSAKDRVISKETREKMNQSKRGKKASAETRAKMSRSRKGKPKSDKHKASIAEALKGNTNGTGKKGIKLSKESRLRISKAISGENHPMYGKSLKESTKKKLSEANRRRENDIDFYFKTLFTSPYTPQYRIDALKHYGHVCENCGVTDVILEVHHLDHDRSNNDISNLCVLCRICHHKIAHKYGKIKINTQFISRIINKRGEINHAST
ncbi:HNH-type endonuclease [Bacillus phage SP-15]|uniref:HNH-type endonuclease n=1 Tax=Bacillus phage SP-15 TaxID=1792032 RepID=A0A127AWC6_9CAUD|nr:HNH endonuclease [Bacillus phage SP-15]AMM44945.1 HNH-type endonuclease [Bacillus phage SP-15]